MHLLALASAVALAVVTVTTALPTDPNQQVLVAPHRHKNASRPLVIWHGLGDTAYGPGILGFIKDVQDVYPGIFVHSVKIPTEGNLDEERRAGFYGNASQQVLEAAAQLSEVPELADGFDAMGFSQGGIFLRSYVQRYNDPPVRNLVTFGSPHMGIASLIPCKPLDFLCIIAKRTAEKGVYTQFAQNNLIQAEYFRDQNRLDQFHEMNVFLTTLNGELAAQPEAARNIASLENFVTVIFDLDVTVNPKESAQFGSIPPAVANASKEIWDLEDHPFLWGQDHIGLRKLSERGRLHFDEHCKGAHMDLGYGAAGDGCAKRVVNRWVGWRA